MYGVLISKKSRDIKKAINDRFFLVESLDDVLAEYHSLKKKDSDGKVLYDFLLKKLEKRRVSEEQFINDLVSIIMLYVDFTAFKEELSKMLE